MDEMAGRAATAPEPSSVTTTGQSMEEILADLNKSPLFMTELEDNDDVAALQALAYEGTPLENALGFKERGNETFEEKRYGDAREFYSKGISILVAPRKKGEDPEQDQQEGGKEEERKKEEEALESLYANRAACHLELRNFRSCWTDCAGAMRINPRNVKAHYRAARALLAVDRVSEADDACARGLTLDPHSAALLRLSDDIARRKGLLDSKLRAQDERRERAARRARLRRAALVARGILLRSSGSSGEKQEREGHDDARIRLADEDDARSHLVFPVLLLYPLEMQSDVVQAFGETDALGEHLDYVLPPPWDARGMYKGDGVTCFVETSASPPGLMRMGRGVSLLRVLAGGKVPVVDGFVRIFVLPADRAGVWVTEFKAKQKT